LIFSELNTGQIQESIGEAVNGIVKHFHKPEKEVSAFLPSRPAPSEEYRALSIIGSLCYTLPWLWLVQNHP